jgi:ketosteroid isomerase-like protein
MDITYAVAADLLERFRQAWLAFDGDAWTDLFEPDVVYHDGPFDEPFVGRNALRAYLLEAAELQDQLEVVIERHWVVSPTIIAVWHASYVHRSTRARVRIAGVMTLEVGDDGRIARFREWYHRLETPAG